MPLSMSKKLENKAAVITGATSGMALATAKLFVEQGAYVFITGHSQEKLDKTVKEICKNVTGVQGDAGNLADLDRLFETVKKENGRIDVVLASAGVGELQPTRLSYREMLRRYVQPQRSRDFVYRAKGSAAHEGRRVNHSE